MLNGAEIQLEGKVLDEIQGVRELVTSMRALKADRNLSNNREVEFFYLAEDEKAEVLNRNIASILTTVGAAAMNRTEEAQSGMPTLISDFGSIYLDLSSELISVRKRQGWKKKLPSWKRMCKQAKQNLAMTRLPQGHRLKLLKEPDNNWRKTRPSSRKLWKH